MPFSPRLLLTGLAACLACPWSPASASRAPVTSELPSADVAHTADVHSAVVTGAGVAQLGDDAIAALHHDGRELSALTAAAAVSAVGISVLEAFLGAGAGVVVNGIFGSSAVPVDLGALIDNAVKQIDRAVGNRLAEAFNNEKRSLLDSLTVRVREYVRRADLSGSRAQVQDMLDDASELISFFEDSGTVTNNAFQTTLALRLSLLLELFQLDKLIGESEGVLAVVKSSIKTQARTGKASLESWRATYLPTTNDVRATVRVPCNGGKGIRKCKPSTRERKVTVCMDIRSADFSLKRPPHFCKEKTCKSDHIFERIRKRRTKRCASNFEKSISPTIRKHAREVGLDQFRDLNEAAVFGEGFRAFLADLAAVEQFDFDGVALPEVGGSGEEEEDA